MTLRQKSMWFDPIRRHAIMRHHGQQLRCMWFAPIRWRSSALDGKAAVASVHAQPMITGKENKW